MFQQVNQCKAPSFAACAHMSFIHSSIASCFSSWYAFAALSSSDMLAVGSTSRSTTPGDVRLLNSGVKNRFCRGVFGARCSPMWVGFGSHLSLSIEVPSLMFQHCTKLTARNKRRSLVLLIEDVSMLWNLKPVPASFRRPRCRGRNLEKSECLSWFRNTYTNTSK